VKDVAVVGAGVTGLSTAYHLAERGLDVVVLERRAIAAEASGVQLGGVRQQWGTRVNCEMARESIAVYRDLGGRLGTRLRPRFTACGYLFAAHTGGYLRELESSVRLQRELGIPSEILGPNQIAELVPGLDPGDLVGASWCAEDGYFDRAQEPVEAFAEAAFARGVELVIAEAAAVLPDGSGWQLSLRSGDCVSAEHVAVTAGLGSTVLLRTVGVEVPIAPEPHYLFLSDPIHERLLEPLVVAAELRFAGKQLADGRVLASDLQAAGDPERDREAWRRHVRNAVESLLPILVHAPLRHLVEGVYDVTPDGNAIVGPVPGVEGLWLAAGFSGHGFMMAPAVGRILADAITGANQHQWLHELRFARFDEGLTGGEPHVI
jgi:glycine/D-amino acid oxidase-like deaminating enzyme